MGCESRRELNEAKQLASLGGGKGMQTPERKGQKEKGKEAQPGCRREPMTVGSLFVNTETKSTLSLMMHTTHLRL